ncbi:AAA family ATPase [Peptacetobacter hiranonis]|uniref:Nuclease SbcCD subunit C n=1 Tax=Peptacetobacter hiranonis (strain DSM 13275 / JCM 10541 / KCTC 15199 / TO-931) TaxID=500633 RepID=B6G1C0_PEPHT|nr:SbcC/MukB-like Walker B domain-containing protein [Peptacetobacter hiranonis]EEA84438.1 RecF/RecN/SMC N-terminal domain protein [Peptacetobacter hiranonis DSM 13275]QEK21489.1 Nuclease SbcCD subunit C [Peptacetobacter hiranonis]
MRPIKLEIKGLNSYVNKQTIDFEKLTERGLFGIFGKTGSGKSTILDAITLSLYGSIARNTKEYINSLSEKAEISYEFEIGSRRYVVDRHIIRSKAGGIKTSYARVIEKLGDGSENVLADKVNEVNETIIKIIGLTANDFTKSVVLPQDKFNDFLKLGGIDRRNMLERIFNLEKYGKKLIENVRHRKNKTKTHVDMLQVSLSHYEEVTDEKYDEMIKKLEIDKEDCRVKNRLYKEKVEKYDIDKIIYENQKRYNEAKELLKVYEDKKEEIEEKRKKMSRAENANMIDPYIDNVEKLRKQFEDSKNQLKIIEEEIRLIKKDLEISRGKFAEIERKKDDTIPRLSEDKVKFERAIHLLEETNKLSERLTRLKVEGEKLESKKKELLKNIEDIKAQQNLYAGKIKDSENRLYEINVPAAFRQNIEKGYSHIKELNEVKKELEKSEIDLQKCEAEYSENNIALKLVGRDRASVKERIEEVENRINIMIKNSPLTAEEITKKTEYVTEMKSELKTLKQLEEERDNLQHELNDCLEKRHRVSREISTSEDRLSKVRKDMETAKKNIEEFRYLNRVSDIRKELQDGKPCPVCGSLDHMRTDSTNYDDRIEYYEGILNKEKANEREEIERLDSLKIKRSGYISEEKIKTEAINKKKAEIGERNSIELSKKYDSETRNLEAEKRAVSDWNIEKDRLEEDLKRYKDDYSRNDKEFTRIDELLKGIMRRRLSLSENVSELKSKKDNLELEIVSIKRITKVDDIFSKLEEIKANEIESENVEKELSEFRNIKFEIDKEFDDCKTSIHSIEVEISSIEKDFEGNKKQYIEKTDEAQRITRGKNPNELLEKTEQEINKINSSYADLKKEFDDKSKAREDKDSLRSKVQGECNTTEEQLDYYKKVLKDMLAKYRFDSAYTVKKFVMPTVDIEIMRKEISDYDEGRKNLDFKIDDLEKKLDGRKVKEEEFDRLNEEIVLLKDEIGELEKNNAVLFDRITAMKKDLEKKKKIKSEYDEVSNDYRLLDEIDRIIQGNKFVEYVATNHLKYIALEASKRLSTITNGRYALEINDALEFVMRDNFNGGERRGVDTLSGGETFLTSLSLALALSSQIQMKGNAPLEFFFLDEGFGSLDVELLDTVMESLEKLHSSNLSIGIISHVEELKNRVPVKLVVTAGEIGEGSKVKIEYS